MAHKDRLFLLLSVLLLCFLLWGGGGSSALLETPIETPAPHVCFGSVDVNTADAQTLCRLPGVGMELAERIITLREELGAFACPQELTLVSGIGEKKLEKIKEYTED